MQTSYTLKKISVVKCINAIDDTEEEIDEKELEEQVSDLGQTKYNC